MGPLPDASVASATRDSGSARVAERPGRFEPGRRGTLLVVGLVLVATAGLWSSLGLTERSVGYDTDSAVYLGVAHNLATGHGPTVPFTFYTDRYTPQQAVDFRGAVPSTHFPPLYPALLAVFEVAGVSGGDAARVTGALLAAVNLVLFVILVRRALVRRSTLEAVAAACVLLVAGAWIAAYTYVLSEGLMLTWTLAGLLVLTSYLCRPTRAGAAMLVLCSVAAVLTRWVGGSLGITIAILVVSRPGWSARVKLRRAGVILGSLVVATVGWTLVGLVGGDSTPRLLAWHPPAHMPASILLTLDGWFLHEKVPGGRVVVVLGGLLVAAALLFARRPSPHAAAEGRILDQRTWVIVAVATFGLVYLAAVVVARTIFDASIPVTLVGGYARYRVARVYLPLLPVALLLLVAALDQVASSLLPRPAAATPVVVVGVCAAIALLPVGTPRATYRFAGDLIESSSGKLPPAMRSALQALPRGEPLASNVPGAVWLATGRPVIEVPEQRVLVSGRRNPRFRGEVAQLSRILVGRHGTLVLRSGTLGDATEVDFACCGRLVAVMRSGGDRAYRLLALPGS